MNENDEVQGAPEDEQIKVVPTVVSKVYDSRASSRGLKQRFLASNLAWFSLEFAQVVSALNCLGAICAGVYAIIVGLLASNPMLILMSFIATPLAFTFQVAMFVVFAEAAELRRHSAMAAKND